MKVNCKLIFILVILVSTPFYAQKLDSILLEKSIPKIENPNSKKLDSLHKNFNNAIGKLYDQGNIYCANQYKSPILYYVQNDGKQKSLNAYINDQLREITNSFKAYFKIEVDWNGTINSIKLVGYTGNINAIDFARLLDDIKAKPATEFNIPVTTVTSFYLRKN